MAAQNDGHLRYVLSLERRMLHFLQSDKTKDTVVPKTNNCNGNLRVVAGVIRRERVVCGE
jgi:hypothetical protein